MSADERLCRFCGRPKHEHCAFKPFPPAPKGCVCDRGTWGDVEKIPKACAKYIGTGTSYCETCSHNAECHRAKVTL